MAEGVADDGARVDHGHESGRRSPRERPPGVPESYVRDRQTGEWREPRKPGPRAAGDVDGDAGRGDSDSSWRADRDPGAAHLDDHQGDDGRPHVEASGQIREDVESLLALLALPVGALAESRDPYCGGAFAQQLPQIVHAAAPIVCRSQRVVRWMTADTGGLMDWLGLAVALAPVGRAVVEHHVLRVVEEVPAAEPEPVPA